MKRPRIFFIITLVVLLFLGGYLGLRVSEHPTNHTPTNINTSTYDSGSFLFNSGLLLSKRMSEVQAEIIRSPGALRTPLVGENITQYKQELVSECKRIIRSSNIVVVNMGEKQLSMSGFTPVTTDHVLLDGYMRKRHDMDVENEYKTFAEMQQGQCKKKSEELFCRLFQTKKGSPEELQSVRKSMGEYGYYLIRSFISGENQCAPLIDKQDLEDCTNTFSVISNAKSGSLSQITPDNRLLNHKILYQFGAEAYRNKINSDLLQACKSVSFEHP